MKLQVLNIKNEAAESVDLLDTVFDVLPRKDILARIVLWQLAKRRSGNHTVKGKSDVHGTTRKMCRQKGTGGARHGSRKAAQFRGGGIMFGPVKRDHGYDLPKKIRKLGLKMALSAKAKSGNLVLVDKLAFEERVRTKEFLERFSDFKSALFVDSIKNNNVLRALSNIVGFDFIPQIGTNVYDIIRKDKLILSLEAARDLERRLV
jgi:large subunit ribosomal protein L4